MSEEKSGKISSQRQQWKKVFNTLVHMLQTQQQQLESLAEERELFRDHFQSQHHRWASDVQLLEGQISQMKRNLSDTEKLRFLETKKSELYVSLKQREALHYKNQLENAEDDLGNFRSCFDYLTQKLSGENDECGDGNGKNFKGKKGKAGKSMATGEEDRQQMKIIKDELTKLKRAYDNLISKNKSEVSALLLERDFVWNQFGKMEKDCITIRKNKDIEVEAANEKIVKLLSRMEELQISNNEKDETIVKLKDDLAKLEADTENRKKEFSRLSKEVEGLRNSRGASQTPVLGHCTTRALTVSFERQKTSRDRRLVLKKESPSSESSGFGKIIEKESRGSKRKKVETVPDPDTPRLFSSRFKVPKLKNSSGLPT